MSYRNISSAGRGRSAPWLNNILTAHWGLLRVFPHHEVVWPLSFWKALGRKGQKVVVWRNGLWRESQIVWVGRWAAGKQLMWNFLGRLQMVEVFPQRQPHHDPDGSAPMAEDCLSCCSGKVISINTNSPCVQVQLLPFKETQNTMVLHQSLGTLNYNCSYHYLSSFPSKKIPNLYVFYWHSSL